MKKLFIIFSLIIFALGVQAQNADIDVTLEYGDYTYVWFDGGTTDVLTTTDTTWMYTVRKKSFDKLQCYVDLLIDSTGGTANNVVISLQNKKFPDTDYVTVSSITWDGANDYADGYIASFEPSSPTYAFTSSGVDTIAGTITFAPDTLLSLTDTTGLMGYPADSIQTYVTEQIGTVSLTNQNTGTFTMSVTQSDQSNMGEYWRVLIVGADNTLLASIRRLNLKFVKE